MWSNGLTFFVFLNLHLHLCLSMHDSSSPGPARGEPRGGEAGLPRARPRGARAGAGRALGGASRARLRVARTLQGLFSAVSNSIFATVTNYSFETKHSPRSTQCIPLHGSAISNFCLKICQKKFNTPRSTRTGPTRATASPRSGSRGAERPAGWRAAERSCVR